MYVGISQTPELRCRNHSTHRTAPRGSVFNVIKWCRTRVEAAEIEKALIREFKPPMNIQSSKHGPPSVVIRRDVNSTGDEPEFFAMLDEWLNQRKK
jgi:hypothetical protein